MLTEQIQTILDNYKFDFVTADEVETWLKDKDDLSDKLQDSINEQEIIYYYRAMEYLSENDSSLAQSLSLASELGFCIDDLNSEKLATLLYQQNLSEDLAKIVRELEELETEEEGE